MPKQEHTSLGDVKKFLKLERLRSGPRGFRGPFPADTNPSERLRHYHNAKDVLAAIEFIEQHAELEPPVAFPTQTFEELKAALHEVSSSRESVERMGNVLDRIQSLVTDEDGRKTMANEPKSCASHEFAVRHAASERKLEKSSGQSGRALQCFLGQWPQDK